MIERRKFTGFSSAPNMNLFGPTQLLDDEDPATYAALRDRVFADLAPADVIQEMFADDIVAMLWEILRWRRMKTSALKSCGTRALENFLHDALERSDYEA